MTNERKVLAIIPARGGSKRLPRKNILPICGKPLIAWTIEAAIKSNIFDQVIVNTDDNEISTVAKKFGAQVPFIRPAVLAKDTSTSIDVIIHTLEWFKAKEIYFSDVVMLQPTSPLRDYKDIVQAWQLYIDSRAESVVSVCEVEHPIQWTYHIEDGGVMSKLFDDDNKRSQDYEKLYRLNGAIYIGNTKLVLEYEKITTDKTRGYLMTVEKSVDIDNTHDFRYAKFLMSE
jgi:pseudaminic acid cytidylyltransferase